MDKRFVVGITGASGVIYGVRVVEELLKQGMEVHLIVSEPGKLVLADELGWDFSGGLKDACCRGITRHDRGQLFVYENHEIWAAPASGSFQVRCTLVVPCSMSTLAGIAHGLAANLIQRAADVALKEGRPLVLVPRETPLSAIHLDNMSMLARLGVRMVPAMPAFYHKPQSLREIVDFVVGKVFDVIGLEHELFSRYGGIKVRKSQVFSSPGGFIPE